MCAYRKKYGVEKAEDYSEKKQGGFSSGKRFDTKSKTTSGRGGEGSLKGKRGSRRYSEKQKGVEETFPFKDKEIRLNRFIANSGYCSRRQADRYIELGMVEVNGKTVTELGTKVQKTDIVKVDGQRLTPEKKYYVLLNKPRGFITTTDDPFDRRTVMELVKNACQERIYPVGRLDRNTTGLLLFTNDGDLAKLLTHPKHRIRKIYRVRLDKPISKEQLNIIAGGIELEDGFIKVDAIEYVGDARTKTEVGVELHSGRNRIVRRIFEHLGFEVVKLDRTVFANLSKKDLPRGKWRMLDDKEVKFLKMLR